MTSTNGTTNGHSNGTRPHRPLTPGINVPLIALFHPETEQVDIPATTSHAVRLARAGLTSLTVQGSNGEAVHLTRDERTLITRTVRQALDENSFSHLPLIVGCAAQSVRETVQFCHDAYNVGGDYALVLPPGYYKPAYTSDVLLSYFRDVADESPIPIVIYNYPGAVAGVDLSSDQIVALAKHPNIVGCKLTCGNTGKLNRVAHAVHAATASSENSGWLCMGGSADFTLQTMIAGGSGIVTGLGNIVPKSCVRVWELMAAGKVEEAQRMQAIVARADWAVIEGGVVGTKSGLESWFGYGGYARRPLPKPTVAETEKWKEMLRECVELEKSL